MSTASHFQQWLSSPFRETNSTKPPLTLRNDADRGPSDVMGRAVEERLIAVCLLIMPIDGTVVKESSEGKRQDAE